MDQNTTTNNATERKPYERKTIDLSVPRERKDEAKKLGAKWNRFRGVWYVQKGTDLSPFQQLGFAA